MLMEMLKVDTGRCLKMSEEEMLQSLPCFYRAVAEAAGYTETENTLYDCREILVASNVQDAIIRHYEMAFPKISKEQICTLLLLCGPKVCTELKENEVVIQQGFISENSK